MRNIENWELEKQENDETMRKQQKNWFKKGETMIKKEKQKIGKLEKKGKGMEKGREIREN